MANTDIRYARNRDIHIAYTVRGPGGGVDLLRVAAFVSSLAHGPAHAPWARVTEPLAALGRLISFDNRGTGLSDREHGAGLPPLEERMDDLRAVLDAAGSRRAVLTCFADGGPLGCLFAATYPERTLALILCNTRPRIAWAPDYPWGMQSDEVVHEIEDIEQRWATRERAEAYARELPLEGLSQEELCTLATAARSTPSRRDSRCRSEPVSRRSPARRRFSSRKP
jgi:pimeloyl-ACP methyl ester carboxylesterase